MVNNKRLIACADHREEQADLDKRWQGDNRTVLL